MTRPDISIDRLARTEYALYDDPDHVSESTFGRFVHNPAFPTRHDANQLFDVRCSTGEVDELLVEIDQLYEPIGVRFRKLEFHHAATAAHLVPDLERHGWRFKRYWMMVFEKAPQRPVSPWLHVTTVPLDDPDGHRQVLFEAGGFSDDFQFRRAQDERLGGEVLVAYLNDRPAGVSGWFQVRGIVRFRPLHTLARFRGQGVATTLILHIEEHPAVKAADALCIYCDASGPLRLYEQLGFVKRGEIWSGLLEPR